MKQTWSIPTVNTNHESVPVGTTLTLLKAGEHPSSHSRSTAVQQEAAQSKSTGTRGPPLPLLYRELDKRFTSLDLGSHWYEETELDTSFANC